MILRIDGLEIPVYQNEICRYAIYSAPNCNKKEAEVEILTEQAFAGAVAVKPLKQNIRAQVKGEQIRLHAPIPAKLSIEFEDADVMPLFLFLYETETEIPAGENVIRFEAGEHHVGLLELHSGDVLYLAEGAILRGTLKAFDGENITVCGRGIIDADVVGDKVRRMLDFRRLKNVTIRDVTLTGSFSWCTVLTASENVTVDGVNIMTWRCTGDGIDIVGSNNVLVQNCFIRANDDCVAIKAVDYFDPDGMRNVYDVTVRSCVMWNAHFGNGIEIGFETRCDEICNVTFEDLDIIHCEHEGWQSGGTLTIHNGDRARVHHVVYRDIRVEDSYDKLFDFKVMHSRYSRDEARGSVDNVLVERVEVVAGHIPPSILSGFTPDDHLVTNVRFVDVKFLGEAIDNMIDCRMVAERTKEITFERSEV